MSDTVTPTILPAENPPAQPTDLALAPQQALGATASALSARVQAEIQIRTMVALSRPRDWDLVRQRMMKECARPKFAEQALYRKPLGGGKFAEGFSVRFAEALQRNIGNLSTETVAVEEDLESVKLKVSTIDLESNASFSTDVTVRKTVERRFPKEGQTVISSRRNSTGDIVYLVEASEDEIVTKQNALVSKALRNNIVRLCPGDIQDDCEEKIKGVLAARAKADPDAERKRLLDFFGEFSVTPAQLREYLGHEVGPGQVTLEEMEDLRKVYAALKGRETSWTEVMRLKAETLGKAADTAASRAAAAVNAKLEKK